MHSHAPKTHSHPPDRTCRWMGSSTTASCHLAIPRLRRPQCGYHPMSVLSTDVSFLAVRPDAACNTASERDVRCIIPFCFELQHLFPKFECQSWIIRSESLIGAEPAHIESREMVRVSVGRDDLQRTNQIVSESALVRTAECHTRPDDCDHSF